MEPPKKRVFGTIALLPATFAGASAWNIAFASEDDQTAVAVIRLEEMSTLAKR